MLFGYEITYTVREDFGHFGNEENVILMVKLNKEQKYTTKHAPTEPAHVCMGESRGREKCSKAEI